VVALLLYPYLVRSVPVMGMLSEKGNPREDTEEEQG